MYHLKKRYHDENYRDPEPIGTCCVCGCPVEQGDSFYLVEEGLVHGDGEFCRVQIGGVSTSVSCLMAYMIQGYNPPDVAAALGLVRRKRSEWS